MARRFPPEVHEFIAANIAGRSTKEMTALVNERFGLDFTESSMRAYKKNHRLKSGAPKGNPPGTPSKTFPKEVREYILQNYRGCGNKEMAQRLNELFGTEYTTRQLNTFYKNHHLNSGLTGCFEKGHVPFNKGIKGWTAPGSERTRFKKGDLPADTKPIGYERVSRDGYIEVKVKMRPTTSDCNDNFVAKHRLIWEQEHGPIPDGHIVIFKNGDKRDLRPENLALVTQAENAVMNRWDLRSNNAELTEAGIAVAKLKIAIQEKKRRRKKCTTS